MHFFFNDPLFALDFTYTKIQILSNYSIYF